MKPQFVFRFDRGPASIAALAPWRCCHGAGGQALLQGPHDHAHRSDLARRHQRSRRPSRRAPSRPVHSRQSDHRRRRTCRAAPASSPPIVSTTRPKRMVSRSPSSSAARRRSQIEGDPNAKFDPLKLTWLGSLSSYANDAYILVVNSQNPVKSVADLKKPGRRVEDRRRYAGLDQSHLCDPRQGRARPQYRCRARL